MRPVLSDRHRWGSSTKLILKHKRWGEMIATVAIHNILLYTPYAAVNYIHNLLVSFKLAHCQHIVRSGVCASILFDISTVDVHLMGNIISG